MTATPPPDAAPDDDDHTEGALGFLNDLSSLLRTFASTSDPEDLQLMNAFRVLLGHVALERDRMLDGRCQTCGEKIDEEEQDPDASGRTIQ